MILKGNYRAAAISLVAVALSACASGPVALKDKDTSGQFDGIWIASVSEPLAKREELPGNWFMTCDWEPFTLTLQVNDGMVGRVGSDARTPISSEGRFRLVESFGGASVIGGVASNERVDQHYSGNLAESGGTGKYLSAHPSIGANGCRGKVSYARR